MPLLFAILEKREIVGIFIVKRNIAILLNKYEIFIRNLRVRGVTGTYVIALILSTFTAQGKKSSEYL